MQEVAANYAPWNEMALKIAFALWAVSVLIVIGHVVKLAITNDAKTKYDYINRSEIKILWIASIILIIGTCFFANSDIVQEVSPVWIAVRGFVTFSMGMIAALIIQNLLKFYYPFYIEKRLKALRYQPRISPKCSPGSSTR